MATITRHMSLGVASFAIACGVTWGLAIAILGMMAALFGWGIGLASVFQDLYLGFGPSFVGAIAGAVWGFVNGFIFGMLIAWIYNRTLLSRQHHVAPHMHSHPPEHTSAPDTPRAPD